MYQDNIIRTKGSQMLSYLYYDSCDISSSSFFPISTTDMHELHLSLWV